jgi:hypothetical protein
LHWLKQASAAEADLTRLSRVRPKGRTLQNGGSARPAAGLKPCTSFDGLFPNLGIQAHSVTADRFLASNNNVATDHVAAAPMAATRRRINYRVLAILE